MLEHRAVQALRRPANWIQLGKFGAVGASGYVVNLLVYTTLLRQAHLHYLVAATCSFVVAASWNYLWNRTWTFRAQRGHFGYQGMRFFVVSGLALVANQVWLLIFIDWFGLDALVAQAIAIALTVPLNFLGNKLWSFRA